MATITTINATDKIGDSRSVINTNFSNLNTDKLEAVTVTSADFTGDGTSGSPLTLGTVKLTINEPAADNSAGTQSIFDSGTVGETVALPALLYLKSDGKWWKADADAAATMPGLRMALESKNADEACSMLVMGRVRDDDWNWTVAGLIYADTTPGALTQTAPSGTGDQQQIVGFATSADTMIFAPSPDMGEVA